jgi:type I restriction enzyme S subunit
MTELPPGWVIRRVHEVFESFGGGTPNKATQNYWGGTIPWLSSGDIKTDRIQAGSETITKAGLENSSANLCRPGSVLVVVRSGILKHTLPIAVVEREAAINQDIKCFDSGNDELNRWLALGLRTSAKDILALNREGTTVQSVKYETLKEFALPVPPPAEQRRIVAQLEKLLDKLDGCHQRLAKIPALFKRFRQSILAAACSGRLTADWRGPQAEVESGRRLAERINEVRRKKTNARLIELLPEGEWPDDAIPETWSWVRFGSVIGELRNGVSLRPNIDPPGVPILRISAARPGAVDLNEVRYMLNGEGFVPQFTLRDRDLLFTRYNGSIDLLGVCGMVRGLGRRTLLYPDKLMRVRFDHDFVLPAYAELFFQASEVHDRVVGKAKSSAGQNGVSGSDIKTQPFALVPVAEQQEIVRRAEALFSLADQLEARFLKGKAQVDKLTPSLLARAFRGELVPTEAELANQDGRDYESASAFLERIHHDRALEADQRPGRPTRLAGSAG